MHSVIIAPPFEAGGCWYNKIFEFEFVIVWWTSSRELTNLYPALKTTCFIKALSRPNTKKIWVVVMSWDLDAITGIILHMRLANDVVPHWLGAYKQGKSEGFDSCDRPSNPKLDSNRRFFSLCDLEIWWMTSKNNRALLYYIKLCASFQIHRWSQT